MSLETGLYTIQNVHSANLVELPDPNDGSALIAAPENFGTSQKVSSISCMLFHRRDSKIFQWNVVKLGNGKFTLQNRGHASFANNGVRSSADTEVAGRSSSQQFVIAETRIKGHYTFVVLSRSRSNSAYVASFRISPSDVQLCWGVPDDEIGTPVST